jgi:NADH-quinone oxidoreductase subunit L
MAFALIVLAIGSVFAGYASLGGRFERFLAPSFLVPEPETQFVALAGPPFPTERALMAVSSIVAVAGIGIAMFFFLKRRAAADRVARQFTGLHRVLEHKYYVDEIYDAALVQPIHVVSEEGLWKTIDVKVIDGAVNGIADAVRGGSEILRRLQTGSVRAYAASLFLGVVMVLGYYLWR